MCFIILIGAQIISFLAIRSLFNLSPASLVACLLSGMARCSRLIVNVSFTRTFLSKGLLFTFHGKCYFDNTIWVLFQGWLLFLGLSSKQNLEERHREKESATHMSLQVQDKI